MTDISSCASSAPDNRALSAAEARARMLAQVRDGRLPVTVEVIYGHAWKAPPRKTADGRTIVRFEPRPPAR